MIDEIPERKVHELEVRTQAFATSRGKDGEKVIFGWNYPG
jgi:hypothetical protein